jgi:hypothetical protein
MNLPAWVSEPSVFYPLIIWSVIWKGLALWPAARNNQRLWYFALLIINTLGLLEIIYLGFFRKDKNVAISD